MIKNWEDPKTWDEWLNRFTEVQQELDIIEDVEPIHLEPGECAEIHLINRAYTLVELSFKQLGGIKDRCRRLQSVAKRWYDQKVNTEMLNASRLYPNQKLQKAHAENNAVKEFENFEAARLLTEAIKDERSRLWNYREDLEQMGHNTRKEMSFK